MTKQSIIERYDQIAKGFSEEEIAQKETESVERFIPYLDKGARIFDAGCGSGFHTKLFLSKGFNVLAADASKEMCRFAGCPVENLGFHEIDSTTSLTPSGQVLPSFITQLMS